ncbi:MAG: hypothetical protein O3C28_14625, partial [Proteobacteria bacterium]|nr:hypothetical protein [Pseudomonadota bacterium]
DVHFGAIHDTNFQQVRVLHRLARRRVAIYQMIDRNNSNPPIVGIRKIPVACERFLTGINDLHFDSTRIDVILNFGSRPT